MDEAALRLPECLSLPALSLNLSLPEGVRSNYTQTLAALRGFWPALPGVSNFDDLNENYGVPILKQGQDSIERFAPKVCAVASSIANGDTQRLDRLAKYLLWKGLSVDVSIWIDKYFDDSITFADWCAILIAQQLLWQNMESPMSIFRNLHLRVNLARDCFTSTAPTVTNSVQRGKTTTGSALDGAVFDIAQILAYLVHNMTRSQLCLGFGHFDWLPSFFG